MKRLIATLMLTTAALCAHAADGEVKRIDAAQARITIKHDGIPNLSMPAMTMVFRVQDPKALSGLNVGDRVHFSADKVASEYTVTAIQKTP